MNISVNIEFAKMHGMCEAFIMAALQPNFMTRPEIHDGNYWYKASRETFADLIGYSTAQVGRSLKYLVRKGYVIVGCFNENPYDRTNWYRAAKPL